MSKDMLIDSAHAEEIRIAVVDDGKLDKFDFETRSKVRVKGNIYLAKVIRVEPSLQAAFIDYGGNRHGFLSFSEIHYDYFQIPVSDRQELEAHLQNAIAAYVEETGKTAEEMDAREISRLRYQFYRRYKIQEVIKKRQIMLVQVTKEERGNKGAALTTYISLAGRYCVLMPNTSKGSGVSRKITNRSDREKLKKIVSELHIENGSTVIRTAGIGHTKTEIKKDFAYLKNIWDEIRETTLKSSAPCLIHEEAGVIKRSLRDMYSKEIDSVVVEGEAGYKVAKNFMKKLMPSHSRKVKLYNDKNVPLFSKYKLNEQINQIYSTRVDLPSGGYLVINNTEALIAIDVNSGRSTRERNIAGTALKTNLEAAHEIARQCRLRDLAGLIVVDFIDMEEKRNNIQVERCMRESLKSDKAKIQVGNISNFGLLEFSRQRLRSSIADANMIVCPHCRGTGFMWSEESMAIQVLRKIEEACIASEFKEIIVTLSPVIALYILNNKRSFISAIESRGSLKITFNTDHRIATNDFKIEQIFKPQPIVFDDEESAEVEEEKGSTEKTFIKKSSGKKSETRENSSSEASETKSTQKKKGYKSRSNMEKTEQEADSEDTVVQESSEESLPATRKIARRSNTKDRKRSRKTDVSEFKKKSEKVAESDEKSNKKAKRTEKSSKKAESGVKKGSAQVTESQDISDKNSQKQTPSPEIPELKEGKVDFQAPIEVSEYQQEIVSRVMQTYQKKELRNASISPNSGKKKSGWWQKLLKKPQNKPLENS
ncbi:MAG: Rne/Rng family ribonuclease [Alphaproteobacteria bacterium]|nr:Rne/Rng family ribonuclease [Alphaproteobacteria bacterium]